MMQRWDAEDFLEEMGAEQFDLWKEFYSIEPFGPYAEDQRSAMQQWLTAKHNPKKPFKLEDFMLSKTKRPPRKINYKLMRERLEAVLGKPDGQH